VQIRDLKAVGILSCARKGLGTMRLESKGDSVIQGLDRERGQFYRPEKRNWAHFYFDCGPLLYLRVDILL
jgi:hypothetical protein